MHFAQQVQTTSCLSLVQQEALLSVCDTFVDYAKPQSVYAELPVNLTALCVLS